MWATQPLWPRAVPVLVPAPASVLTSRRGGLERGGHQRPVWCAVADNRSPLQRSPANAGSMARCRPRTRASSVVGAAGRRAAPRSGRRRRPRWFRRLAVATAGGGRRRQAAPVWAGRRSGRWRCAAPGWPGRHVRWPVRPAARPPPAGCAWRQAGPERAGPRPEQGHRTGQQTASNAAGPGGDVGANRQSMAG